MLYRILAVILIAASFYSCNSETSSVNSDKKSIDIKSKEKTEQKAEILSIPVDDINSSEKNSSGISSFGDLSFLKKYKGKYPRDVKLLDNPIIIKRLTKLIGKQFEYLKEIWEVETPIEIKDGFFYAYAMQAHSGGDPAAVIMADFKKNVLFVGIRKNQNINVYSEDRSKAPKRLLDWSME